MSSLEERAQMFAEFAHYGKTRRDKQTLSILHLRRVATNVAKFEPIPEIVAAAWLHDSVEDNSKVTIEDIKKHFGTCVADIVDDLTDKLDGSYVKQLKYACGGAKIIKLFDVIDNLTDMKGIDMNKRSKYLEKHKEYLRVLLEGD